MDRPLLQPLLDRVQRGLRLFWRPCIDRSDGFNRQSQPSPIGQRQWLIWFGTPSIRVASICVVMFGSSRSKRKARIYCYVEAKLTGSILAEVAGLPWLQRKSPVWLYGVGENTHT